jgi:hypothetical protein
LSWVEYGTARPYVITKQAPLGNLNTVKAWGNKIFVKIK